MWLGCPICHPEASVPYDDLGVEAGLFTTLRLPEGMREYQLHGDHEVALAECGRRGEPVDMNKWIERSYA